MSLFFLSYCRLPALSHTYRSQIPFSFSMPTSFFVFYLILGSNYPDKTNRRSVRLALSSGVDRKVFVKTRASWRLSKKAQDNMHRSDPKVSISSYLSSLSPFLYILF
jgi:hypothetical protein